MQAIARHCPKLRELTINDDRYYSLAPLSQLRSLQGLHCYGGQLNDVAMAALADLPDFQSLGIELPNPTCMSHLGRLGTKIHQLSLRNQAGIGPESLTNASDWQEITELIELEELTIMAMISVDAKLLRAVSSLPRLKAFHVYGDLNPEDHSKLRRYTMDDIAAFRQSRQDVELHIDGKEFPVAR